MKRLLLKLWRYVVPIRCGDPCFFTSRSPQGMGRHRARCAVRKALQARAAEAQP